MGNIAGRNEQEEGGTQQTPQQGGRSRVGSTETTQGTFLGGTTDEDTVMQVPGAGGGRTSSAREHAVVQAGGATTSTQFGATAATPSASATEEDPVDVVERLFGDHGGVPMVFRWEGGGDEVYITGTFNNWAAKIPMQRSGNDFVLIQELARGRHAYKFIVDDEWRFASEEQHMVDLEGNVNNYVDLSDFRPKFEGLAELRWRRNVEKEVFNQQIPDINDYTTEPPVMPPHMRNVYLNRRGGTPLPVTLDHLYCTARQNGLMALGMSSRLRSKFVTTIYFTPVSGGFPLVQRRAPAGGAVPPQNELKGMGQPSASATHQPPGAQPQQLHQAPMSMAGASAAMGGGISSGFGSSRPAVAAGVPPPSTSQQQQQQQ